MDSKWGCKQSTRERILDATLNIIGNEGFQNVTIKKIASLAEVNIAAVNYHFGSKDNVIDEAMKVFSKRIMKCFELLEDNDVLPEERLKNFLQNYSDTTLECPDVFRNIVNHGVGNCDIESDYMKFLKDAGYKKILDTLKAVGVEGSDEVLLMKVFQALGALEIPLLLGNYTEKISGIDYNEKPTRNVYINLILKSLLSK
ncbi:TetR family transcriptional regulator [Clostridium carboxidivorans P7]|uniref:Transcriptional regulator, TetR family n=1 Tax=Clostridium carboxidivorans P7 TaxID=536227 RepID=C6PWP3_9CLOT|nr:TetR/AcrR family transcriptional regulator [Clostridium carboxidivorans]AKN29599.1 TetR family transcriptional regulator [Clostridium carboxidivorans P7]EET86331.1 transcriptional regulator, TetR family [Clostridium carboxidivorans P7]EFG89476.1 transcriptional regulator, TetR family [Clostridium carboxidivorans P7]